MTMCFYCNNFFFFLFKHSPYFLITPHRGYNHCHHTPSISSLKLLPFFKIRMLWFVMRGLLFIFLLRINDTSQQLKMSNYRLSYRHGFKKNPTSIHNTQLHNSFYAVLSLQSQSSQAFYATIRVRSFFPMHPVFPPVCYTTLSDHQNNDCN